MANKYAPIVEHLQACSPYDARRGRPVDEAHLRRMEVELGHPLPADYREFLRDYGSVELLGATGAGVEFPLRENDDLQEGSLYTFLGSTEEQTLAEFYHQCRENYGVLENGYEWYPGLCLVRDISHPVAEMEWPEELLPIGFDMQANAICLALFGLRPGAIFLWMNVPRRNAQNLYIIANSFDEFMHLVEPRSEEKGS